MFLHTLEVSGLRNLQPFSLSFSPGFNLIYGPNGSGKSSFLESLALLGTGRSWRTNQFRHYLQHGSSELLVAATIESDSVHRIGMTRLSDSQVLYRVDREPAKRLSQVTELFPFVIGHPDSIQLVDGSSSNRRKYLDLCLFHVEPSFLQLSNTYNKLLKQRNSLLRSGRINRLEFQVWDEEIALAGEELTRLRKALVESWLPCFYHYTDQFLPEIRLEIRYRQGWSKRVQLIEALRHSFETDVARGFTSVGPHRCDFAIVVNDAGDAKNLFSRGQKKLLVTTLLLSLCDMISRNGEPPVFALDDLASELDHHNRHQLLAIIQDLGLQVFVTVPDLELLQIDAMDTPFSMFHVEHGKIESIEP